VGGGGGERVGVKVWAKAGEVAAAIFVYSGRMWSLIYGIGPGTRGIYGSFFF
jgi:hypothetical protein